MMKRHVIQQDDPAWAENRHDNLLNKGFKHVPIDTARDLNPSEEPLAGSRADHREPCAFSGWLVGHRPFSTRGIAIRPTHPGHAAHLIHRNDVFRPKGFYGVREVLPGRFDIFPLLLLGPFRFFFA